MSLTSPLTSYASSANNQYATALHARGSRGELYYPSHNLDKRDRLSVEFDSLDFLNRNGVTNTPKTF